MSLRLLYLYAGICVVMSSCDSTDRMKSRGAIVLGDPATIVTETDSQYLRNFITDSRLLSTPPETPPAVSPDTARPADTVAKQEPAAAPADTPPADAGLTVDFGEIRVFIPDIETRTYSGSIKNRNSAAYQLTGGRLAGNKLQITGSGKVERVSQRYETSVRYKHELGTLLLESLNYTSGWQTLKGTRDIPVTGIEDKKLQYTKAAPARIRTAVTSAVREKRLPRKKEQEYLNDIRNVRSVTQKPLDVVLRTVIWQITGKDSKGRSFQKELRIDMSV